MPGREEDPPAQIAEHPMLPVNGILLWLGARTHGEVPGAAVDLLHGHEPSIDEDAEVVPRAPMPEMQAPSDGSKVVAREEQETFVDYPPRRMLERLRLVPAREETHDE